MRHGIGQNFQFLVSLPTSAQNWKLEEGMFKVECGQLSWAPLHMDGGHLEVCCGLLGVFSIDEQSK
jgi:hypothetical protein